MNNSKLSKFPLNTFFDYWKHNMKEMNPASTALGMGRHDMPSLRQSRTQESN